MQPYYDADLPCLYTLHSFIRKLVLAYAASMFAKSVTPQFRDRHEGPIETDKTMFKEIGQHVHHKYFRVSASLYQKHA